MFYTLFKDVFRFPRVYYSYSCMYLNHYFINKGLRFHIVTSYMYFVWWTLLSSSPSQSIHTSVMHSLTCIPLDVMRSSNRVEWLPLLHSIAMMHASLRLRGQVCPYSWSNGYHWNYNHLMVWVMYVMYVCVCVVYCVLWLYGYLVAPLQSLSYIRIID